MASAERAPKQSRDVETSSNPDNPVTESMTRFNLEPQVRRAVRNPAREALNPDTILQLQRRYGNQFVLRLIARAPLETSTIQRVPRDYLEVDQTVYFPVMTVIHNWWIAPRTSAKIKSLPGGGDIVVELTSGDYKGQTVNVDPRKIETRLAVVMKNETDKDGVKIEDEMRETERIIAAKVTPLINTFSYIGKFHTAIKEELSKFTEERTRVASLKADESLQPKYEHSEWEKVYSRLDDLVEQARAYATIVRASSVITVPDLYNDIINNRFDFAQPSGDIDMNKVCQRFNLLSQQGAGFIWNQKKEALRNEKQFDIDAAVDIYKAVESDTDIPGTLAKYGKTMRENKVLYAALYGKDIEQHIRDRLGDRWRTRRDALLPLLNVNAPYYKTSQEPEVTEEVPGGKSGIKTNTNSKETGHPDQTTRNLFSHQYRGERAFATRWVQFVWSEVYVSSSDGTRLATAAGNILLEPSNGPMTLTTDPRDPVIHVDAATGALTPYYEERGKSYRSDDVSEIIDTPKLLGTFGGLALKIPEWNEKLKPLFYKTKGNLVTATSHFDAFLVQDDRVISKNSISVVNQWKSKSGYYEITEDDRIDIGGITPAGGFPYAYRSALLVRFPKYSYIT